MKKLLLKMPEDLWHRMKNIPGAAYNTNAWIRSAIEHECIYFEKWASKQQTLFENKKIQSC